MKLHKFLVLLAAMALSTAAFAGNASSNSAMIEESVSSAAETVGDEVDQKVLQNTQNAITVGLLVVDAHRDLNEMTENDTAIGEAMEKTVPAILNKIQTSSDEVYEELQPVLQDLTTRVLKNQTIYPDKLIDRETAEGIMFLTAINQAQAKGLLSDNVAQILTMELLQATFGQ